VRILPLAALAVAASLDAAAVLAQVTEVVITGTRVSSDEYSRMPAVVLERRADFLVQRIKLTNDTRAADGRSREIYQTIKDMLADAGRRSDIAMGYGDDFLIPLTAANYQVPLTGDGRADTSAVEVYVKMALTENADVGKAIPALAGFIKNVRVSGRTEVLSRGDVDLSLVTPEKYRYDIIARITEDAKRLQAGVGQHCKVEISGLSNRVSWQRSDISELTLYIPYQITLRDCQ
jgi:hypothetical protein